jgi:hypothetical protein
MFFTNLRATMKVGINQPSKVALTAQGESPRLFW